jgi:hypothetical protein
MIHLKTMIFAVILTVMLNIVIIPFLRGLLGK